MGFRSSKSTCPPVKIVVKETPIKNPAKCGEPYDHPISSLVNFKAFLQIFIFCNKALSVYLTPLLLPVVPLVWNTIAIFFKSLTFNNSTTSVYFFSLISEGNGTNVFPILLHAKKFT